MQAKTATKTIIPPVVKHKGLQALSQQIRNACLFLSACKMDIKDTHPGPTSTCSEMLFSTASNIAMNESEMATPKHVEQLLVELV